MSNQLARDIVRDILDDMLDRSGLGNALEEIDDITRDEMIATWECFVRGRLAGVLTGATTAEGPKCNLCEARESEHTVATFVGIPFAVCPRMP